MRSMSNGSFRIEICHRITSYEVYGYTRFRKAAFWAHLELNVGDLGPSVVMLLFEYFQRSKELFKSSQITLGGQKKEDVTPVYLLLESIVISTTRCNPIYASFLGTTLGSIIHNNDFHIP